MREPSSQRTGEKDHEQRGARERGSRAQKRRQPHDNEREHGERKAGHEHRSQPHGRRRIVEPTRQGKKDVERAAKKDHGHRVSPHRGRRDPANNPARRERHHERGQRGLDETADHTGMTFALAVNYGSRAEIARAARQIARDVAAGALDPDDVDEGAVASRLYTSGLPDPDLLIRTSGELRLSNYLLWQLAYTEFYVTPTLWPDFSRWDFLRAVASYQSRSRRFGGVVTP